MFSRAVFEIAAKGIGGEIGHFGDFLDANFSFEMFGGVIVDLVKSGRFFVIWIVFDNPRGQRL